MASKYKVFKHLKIKHLDDYSCKIEVDEVKIQSLKKYDNTKVDYKYDTNTYYWNRPLDMDDKDWGVFVKNIGVVKSCYDTPVLFMYNENAWDCGVEVDALNEEHPAYEMFSDNVKELLQWFKYHKRYMREHIDEFIFRQGDYSCTIQGYYRGDKFKLSK